LRIATVGDFWATRMNLPQRRIPPHRGRSSLPNDRMCCRLGGGLDHGCRISICGFDIGYFIHLLLSRLADWRFGARHWRRGHPVECGLVRTESAITQSEQSGDGRDQRGCRRRAASPPWAISTAPKMNLPGRSMVKLAPPKARADLDVSRLAVPGLM
jgi:hypothetical protein